MKRSKNEFDRSSALRDFYASTSGHSLAAQEAASNRDHTPFGKRSLSLPVEWSDEGITGWKIVRITRKGLVSAHAGTPIQLTTFAECREDHPVPHPLCGCGFYARPTKPQPGRSTEAIARVELRGTIIEHDFGWRGEFQRILHLEVDPGQTLPELRNRLHVEVRPW